METAPTLEIPAPPSFARSSAEPPPIAHTCATVSHESLTHMSLSSLLYYALFGEGELTDELP
jgi:hypothetical protein